MKTNIRKNIRIGCTNMKKSFIKSFIIVVCSFLIATNGFCADIDLSQSFISDKADILNNRTEEQLGDVLKNLHKDTSSDLVVVTLNSLENGKTFSDIEKEIETKYILGGESRDKWAMVIVTRNPYNMNIRVGKGLKQEIPNSMKRALGIEFMLNKLIVGNQTSVFAGTTQSNLYSTVLLLGEAIADKKGVRLHTSARDYDFLGYPVRENGMNIPRSTENPLF